MTVIFYRINYVKMTLFSEILSNGQSDSEMHDQNGRYLDQKDFRLK